MALLHVTYMSQALWRLVPLQVILPADKADMQGNLLPLKQYKTLYLLNGLHGCEKDWILNTRIRMWAERHDLAVVMPAGDNSFYADREESMNRYGEYIGKELVEITRRMFPLSPRREDTFIGGLSMGGYGAIRTGLRYPETFGAVVGLSSALHVFDEQVTLTGKNKDFYDSLFGGVENAYQTDKNPALLIRELAEKKKKDPSLMLPRIYMACGTEDFLLGSNRAYRKIFEENGFDLTYVEAPGEHNWIFWDAFIKEAMDWLPLDEESVGMGSGSIASSAKSN